MQAAALGWRGGAPCLRGAALAALAARRGLASKAAARKAGGAQLPAKRRRDNYGNAGARRSGFEAHGFEAGAAEEGAQRKVEPALARPLARRASPAREPAREAARREPGSEFFREPARVGAPHRPGLPAELSGASEREAAAEIPTLDWEWVPPNNVRREVEEQVREEELITYVAGSRAAGGVAGGASAAAAVADADASAAADASAGAGAAETVTAIPRQSRRQRIAEWTLKTEEHLDGSGGYIVVREGEPLSAEEVVTALQAHRAHDVRRIVTARGDDAIICTATSRPHMRKLSEVIYQSLKQRGMLKPGVGKVRRERARAGARAGAQAAPGPGRWRCVDACPACVRIEVGPLWPTTRRLCRSLFPPRREGGIQAQESSPSKAKRTQSDLEES
jgi:hypothetical protein